MTAAPETAPDTAVDLLLAERAQTSAEVLAGLITAGMLETVGRPAKLPELTFAHIPAEHVREVWDAALAVGLRAGRQQARSRWQTEDLDAARDALFDAGFVAMARTVARTAYAAPSRPLEES